MQYMAGDQPVEQMAQCRELLLDALGLVGLCLDLDPGRDVQRFDVEEVLDPGPGFNPAEETRDLWSRLRDSWNDLVLSARHEARPAGVSR
jgi:hypothetical protein